jgi:hypothetical protein
VISRKNCSLNVEHISLYGEPVGSGIKSPVGAGSDLGADAEIAE